MAQTGFIAFFKIMLYGADRNMYRRCTGLSGHDSVGLFCLVVDLDWSLDRNLEQKRRYTSVILTIL